jgi:processive 1,2-diacylglycerol beta-glucosyltransferase
MDSDKKEARGMKVLFLTSSPGYGHTRAAEAIDLALRNRYPEIETQCLDVTHLIEEDVSGAVKDGYLRMTANHPQLYQKLYDMDKDIYRQLAGKIPADKELVDFLSDQQRRWYPDVNDHSLFSFSSSYKSLDSALINTLINGICQQPRIRAGRLVLQGLLGLVYSILSSRLKNYVSSYAPDLLIATQMYPNALLSRPIQKGVITQPIIGVPTDYGAHGVWVRDTTSLYCVGHETVAEALAEQGVSPARIQVTGIPLMPAFENPPSQARARRSLGLDERPTILITGGQCGIGIVDAVRQLVADESRPYRVLVTAGSSLGNHQGELQHLANTNPDRFRLYSWSDDMVNLLRAADVVVGKPGGLTVSETLACGRPFIATCSLGGQEAHNVQFLQDHGAGMRVELDSLATAVNNLFDHPEELRIMKKRAEQQGHRYAAKTVVTQVENLEREKRIGRWQRQSGRE